MHCFWEYKVNLSDLTLHASSDNFGTATQTNSQNCSQKYMTVMQYRLYGYQKLICLIMQELVIA